jgi:hypothetical protein
MLIVFGDEDVPPTNYVLRADYHSALDGITTGAMKGHASVHLAVGINRHPNRWTPALARRVIASALDHAPELLLQRLNDEGFALNGRPTADAVAGILRVGDLLTQEQAISLLVAEQVGKLPQCREIRADLAKGSTPSQVSELLKQRPAFKDGRNQELLEPTLTCLRSLATIEHAATLLALDPDNLPKEREPTLKASQRRSNFLTERADIATRIAAMTTPQWAANYLTERLLDLNRLRAMGESPEPSQRGLFGALTGVFRGKAPSGMEEVTKLVGNAPKASARDLGTIAERLLSIAANDVDAKTRLAALRAYANVFASDVTAPKALSESLVQIVRTDPNTEVRLAAVASLNDHEPRVALLADSLPGSVRAAVIGQIVAAGRGPAIEEKARKFLSDDPSVDVRLAAVQCVDDPQTLANTAIEDDDAGVRKAALDRLARRDQSLLAHLVQAALDPAICFGAFELIDDEHLLYKIATSNAWWRPRIVERLTNMQGLATLALKFEEIGKTAYERLFGYATSYRSSVYRFLCEKCGGTGALTQSTQEHLPALGAEPRPGERLVAHEVSASCERCSEDRVLVAMSIPESEDWARNIGIDLEQVRTLNRRYGKPLSAITGRA